MESRDATRLAALQQATSLLALEKTAIQAESDRLAAKYGKDSQQGQGATSRMAAQAQQQAAVVADLLRASTPVPSPEQGTFVVYGRVIDAQGKGLTSAKIVAAGINGSSLVSTSTKGQGAFELRVPLTSRRKASNKAEKGLLGRKHGELSVGGVGQKQGAALHVA